MNRFKKYQAIFSISLQESLQFRGQMFFWMLLEMCQLLAIILVWRAIFKRQASVEVYRFQQIGTYYISVFMVESLTAAHNEYNMEDIVRTGKLTKYLTRPMSFFWYRWANNMAWRVLRLLTTVPVYIIIFYLFRQYVVFPTSNALLRFILTVCLSFILYFLVSYMISYIAFWLLKITSLINLIRYSLLQILSGFLIPLDLFPKWFITLTDYLPFKYLIYFPVKVYLGQVSGPAFWHGVLMILLWITVLGILVKVIWPFALRKYEAVGI